MKNLSELPNIGNAVANQLKQVGILDEDDLKSIGAEQAWLKIQQIDKTACINKLYALEGAILTDIKSNSKNGWRCLFETISPFRKGHYLYRSTSK